MLERYTPIAEHAEMNPEIQQRLQELPKVDVLLAQPVAEVLLATYSRARVVAALRAHLETAREAILSGENGTTAFAESAFFDSVAESLSRQSQASLRRVINATGIVLHTNLGRAPLAERALQAATEVARGYSNLEYDVAEGARGSRHDHVAALLCELTGAEAAVVVNNNAAAVMLAVNTHAKDGEVVTSRGELVEIGGSFRIPDVIERSEAALVEVGTTNKTRIDDYANAVTDSTRILLKVHQSNFKIVGFTSEAQREEMVALAAERGLIVVEDLGSGTLVDFEAFGLPHETTVGEVVASGVDLVTFSGDKLLGGPQAGIIVGRADLVATMKQNPLMRALRPGKLNLAALEATLRLYLDEDRLRESLPVLGMLTATDDELSARADELHGALSKIDSIRAEIQAGESFSGGGSLPDEAMPTRVVAVRPIEGSVDALAVALRANTPPIVARIADDALQLDVRTLTADDIAEVAAAFARLAS